jgi:WD40 repeat protein
MCVPGGHQNPGQESASGSSSAQRRTRNHQPWSQSQVRVADSWPTRRGQPVSVALSPPGDRLAWSVGQTLSVSAISDRSCSAPLLQYACALAPGLTWSPGGDKLAYRADDGQGRLLDLSGPIPADAEATQAGIFGMTSTMAFAPDGDRLAALSPSLPGRMTLTVLKPKQRPLWECVLTRDWMSGHGSERLSLVWSPDGRFLACTTGTSAAWLIDADDGQTVGQFDHHSLPVTGLTWVDDGPPLLDGMTWVNLGTTIPDPLSLLVWGITGRRPEGGPA